MKTTRCIAPLLLLALAAAPEALAQSRPRTTVDLGLGASYSSGNYGELTSTDVWSTPLSMKVRRGHWTFKASVPYLRVNGSANVIVLPDDSGGGGRGSDSGGSGRDHPEDDGSVTPSPSPAPNPAGTRKVSGFGDTSLSATYGFNKLRGTHAYLDVTGRVRIPTGSESKGLSVGTTDYVLASEFGVDRGEGGAYISAGRRFPGSNGSLRRTDGWQAGFGGWRNLGERSVLSAGLDWRESSVGGEDPAEAYLAWSRRIGKHLKVGLSAGKGLNSASADYSAGMSLTWRLHTSSDR